MAMEGILHDLSPFLRIYNDGRIERLMGNDTVPASFDKITGVESKDVVVSPDPAVSVRIYVPHGFLSRSGNQTKVPILVYFHGGGFCIESAASPIYQNYLNSLVSAANIVCVSVEYRRAPEHPIPAAYDDAWVALKWVASHADGEGPDEWLNAFGDTKRTFLAGDSAGANITNHVALRFGGEKLSGIAIEGAVLAYPYFWGIERLDGESTDPEKIKLEDESWRVACRWKHGNDDPRINPAKDSELGKLGCGRVLVFVADQDGLYHRGLYYAELLRRSGWGGEVEVMESKGVGHVFYLFNPDCDEAKVTMEKMVGFINAK